jgi:transposase
VVADGRRIEWPIVSSWIIVSGRSNPALPHFRYCWRIPFGTVCGYNVLSYTSPPVSMRKRHVVAARPHFAVPENTAQVARAAFPDGNPYLQLRDELGTLFTNADFADLYPRRGQPELAPWRLALVTVLQFREDLSDRQTAAAVRARIDWKYLVGLELTDPGFDDSVLCEFRSRLLAGGGEKLLLNKLLDRCKTIGLLKAGGRQRTDSTHVLSHVLREMDVVPLAPDQLLFQDRG